jgi:hypothetical protein
MEQLIQSGTDPLSSLSQEHDFKQAEGTDTYALSAPQCVIKDPALLAR